MTPATRPLTRSLRLRLQAEAPTNNCAAYYRVFRDGVVVDRAHTPAALRTWDVDYIEWHLQLGNRVEVREGAADAPLRWSFEGLE